MVCTKCAKKLQKTSLATPDVKRKSDVYLSGSTSNVGGASARAKEREREKARQQGNAAAAAAAGSGQGISKSKLLSGKAKNPYAAYASSCKSCKTRCEVGRKYCQRCAYRDNVCAVCGKNLTADATGKKSAPIVQGQKFNAK